MNQINLDRIIEDIRDEAIDPTAVSEATDRVRDRVFAAVADPEAATLRSCASFQALLRPYLTKTLPESRVMLLEDHIHSCVDCRRALTAARTGKVRIMPRPQRVQHELPRPMKWAAAAAVACVLGLSSWGVMRMLPSSGTRATVQSVSGILYAVSDQSSAPIFSGRQVTEGQRLRTAKDSTALLRLSDGSLVEMNERAELSISKSGRGATIRLDRGDVIVQAAPQGSGALFVHTADCLVTVHGTVFAVNRGVKGTRVSVAEGEVKVEEGGQAKLLHRGDQTSTSPSIEKSAVHDEFSWSRNAAKYLALLGEFSIIQKKLAESPGPALRYSSKLLDLAPAETILYAAIPNLGETLAEANRLFNERIQQSGVLRDWWAEHKPQGPYTLDDIVNRIRTFSGYLGDEIVLSVAGDWQGKYRPPILLAEVKKPGLKAFLEAQMRELGSNARGVFRFVDDPRSEGPQKGETRIEATIQKDVLAIGTAESLYDFADPDREGFADTYFGKVIQQSYDSGAGWLFCANVEHILRHSVEKKENDNMTASGFRDLRFVIYERKEVGGKVENRVALNFRGERRGLASWLGAPGSMGALEFVSPNALVAAGFELRDPQSMLSELFRYAEGHSSAFTDRLEEFQRRSGVRVLSDLAGPLGTDAAFAIDGPIFPVPSWEFVVEVYSPDRLQWTIDKLVADFNRNNPDSQLTLSKEQVGGRMLYTLAAPSLNLEAHYAFADSYLVAGATQGLVLRAIQNRQNGYMLTRSEKFRALLPRDPYPGFSGLIYDNIGPIVGPLIEQFKSIKTLTPAQQASLEALRANTGPGLVYAYGEPHRIVISGTGAMFGLNLEGFSVPGLIGSALEQAKSRPGRSQ